MDQALRRDIRAFIDESFEDIVRDTARLVAVDSVRGPAQEGMPYGPGPKKALDLALKIAGELGLDTVDCQGRLGYAQVGGHGDSYLATITHVDVVPAVGWKEDPFALRRRDGWLIGRGVLDDKGPAILCLYALKYLKDRGVALRYPIRAIMGSDEEKGMSDVEHYIQNYPQPLFCFSPDGNFPLCNGEKGIVHAKVMSAAPAERIVDIQGGVASNVIPDRATALIRWEGELQSSERVQAHREGELWRLEAQGIGGHASHPEGTMNAIGLLVSYLLENEILSGQELAFFQGLDRLHKDPWGAGIGAQAEDERFSPLTIVGGVIGLEEGKIFQSIDCRYPASVTGEWVTGKLKENWGELALVERESDAVPFYMDPTLPAIRACLRAYEEVTGDKSEPYTIGGGTYARHFRYAASFGPEHPERPMPDFAGPIHGVDEAASEAWSKEALEIYILALLELEQLDF